MASQSWLEDQGISRKLSHEYLKSGWLERIGHGAYIRAGDTASWRGAVHALQAQPNRAAIRPGGATALALQGYGQYVPLGTETIWLWGEPGSQLPSWFRQNDWDVLIRFRSARLLSSPVEDHAFHKHNNFVIEVSSLERATLEVAYEVHDASSFIWAAEHVQSLVSLRPNLMQRYLEACASIKVKRVLLYLAARYRLQWLERLDLSRIDLGKGKRQLVKHGCFDSRFQITVPRELANG